MPPLPVLSRLRHLPGCRSALALWWLLARWTLGLLALVLLAAGGPALAEGSREMSQSGGYRAFLEWKNFTTTGTNYVRRTLLHAYAAAGESIDLGSSAKAIGSGNINWIAPDGTTGNAITRCPTATTGRIQTRAQEALGPSTLYGGGYTPCTVTVGAGQSGIWTFEFVSPVPTDNGGVSQLLATDSWTEDATKAYVTAWDITVRSGSTERKGRVFTNLYSGNVNGPTAEFSSVFYVLTVDGYRYSVDPNTMQPYGFHFFANNKGIRQADGSPSYQSGPIGSLTSVQHPMAADDSTNKTHKLFVNPPDSAMPSSATGAFPTNYTSTGAWSYSLRSSWLYSSPQPPTASGFQFVGLEGTPNAMGRYPMGGFFRFTVGQAGNYNVTIDVNGDGVFGNGNDRSLSGAVTVGSNNIYWDGLDGDGVAVPATSTTLGLNTSVVLGNGEVHFPYFDVEQNPTGLSVIRLNGGGAPDARIFWSDTSLGGTASLGGASSSPTGAHSWSTNFGNDRLIDTWAMATPEAALYTTAVAIREADLRMVSKTPSSPGALQGSSVTWTLVINNLGPSPVSDVVLIDRFPAELTALAVSTCSVAGGGSCGSAGFAGSTFTQTLSLSAGATATLVITSSASAYGTLTSPLAITNTAGIQRSADVKDPDAFTPAPAVPTSTITGPVSTLAGIETQCTSAGVPGCNNLISAGLTITPTVNLTVTKSDGMGTVTTGDTVTYTITVANTGPGSASGAVLTDAPGAGLNCTAVACTAASGGGVCPPAGAGAGQLSLANLLGPGVTLPALPAGSSLVLTVDCAVTASGS